MVYFDLADQTERLAGNLTSRAAAGGEKKDLSHSFEMSYCGQMKRKALTSHFL